MENFELNNKTIQIPAFFLCESPVFKAFFQIYLFFIETGYQKEKTEKRVVKTIKYIYPEPRVFISLRVPFDFGLVNYFRTV